MTNIEIEKSKRKIENIFEKIDYLNENDNYDFELVSHLTKYLCVLISGYLEKSIYLLLLKYSEEKSHDYIKNYIHNNLKTFTNAKTEKIETLFKKFNDDWVVKLSEIDNYDEVKASINSIIGQRHRIAHGNDSTIGFVSLKEYYKNINKMIEHIKIEILELN
ncbi:MAG: HEPN domain-containing protein [Spirochaetia bacterium]|nr:HEPN domain-containing protein [Spirochaetia bacterium]